MNKTHIAIAAILTTLAGIAGCEQEGGAERVGEKLDETIERTGDAMEQAADKARDRVKDATE